MTLRYDTISFLSDYGTDDEFVGVVHSVIRSLAPEVAVIDVTHGIAPHDIRGGGLALARSAQYLCPGVVVAVVDPGVATDRRAVAVEVGDGQSVLVGPDNGLLAPAVAMVGGAGRAVHLTNDDYHLGSLGPTFDGRDIFAPVAAHLCLGVELTELGDLVEPAGLRPGVLPVSSVEPDGVRAEVLWVDRFGNAQLNLDPDDLSPLGDRFSLRVGDTVRTAVSVRSFAAAGQQVGLVTDSYGMVSVVLDRRSAADELGLHVGETVQLDPLDDTAPAGAVTPVQLSSRPTAGST